MRTYIRGGLWTNSEDQVLLAGIGKYGHRKWSRVASLFANKTAKQCKARYYEYLADNIRKTPWSRAEEEQLLYLAKALPQQWRSIAAHIQGRTPAQCLEHYEKLLSQAVGADGAAADDARDPAKMRLGEMDPNPETKPAKPDPIDMNDAEKELLQEARARLANTQGKKQRRRAREQQLEDARRLAALQKRRELTAAGIQVKERKSRRDRVQYDLVREIPFQRQVPAGLFAVPDSERPSVDHAALVGKTTRDIEGLTADEQEAQDRERSVKRQKLARAKDPKAALLELAAKKELSSRGARAPLSLPPPQVTDAELGALASHESATAAKMAALGLGPGAAVGLTSGLLTQPSATPGLSSMTPALRGSTPAQGLASRSDLLSQARALKAGTDAQTPLLGGDATPRIHSRGLGHDHDDAGPDDEAAMAAALAAQRKAVRATLRVRLAALPPPKHTELEVTLPDLDAPAPMDTAPTATAAAASVDAGSAATIVDRAEREAAAAAAAAARTEATLSLRSSVVRNNLPRIPKPAADVTAQLLGPTANIYASSHAELAHAEQLILVEANAMIATDAARGDAAVTDANDPEAELSALMAAASLIDDEVGDAPIPVDELAPPTAWIPKADAAVTSVDAASAALDGFRKTISKLSKRAAKNETKATTLSAGLMHKSAQLDDQITSLADQIVKARIDVRAYAQLRDEEALGIRERIASLQAVLARQRVIEADLQARYAAAQSLVR